MRLLAWFCEMLDTPEARRWRFVRDVIAASKARVARDLRQSVRALGNILILRGCARMNFAHRRIHQRGFPSSHAAGLRAMRASSALRRLRRVLAGMNDGSLRQRAERLAAALDNLEPLIARMLKHMRAMWRWARAPALILTAAPAPLMRGSTLCAPALLDSS